VGSAGCVVGLGVGLVVAGKKMKKEK